MNLFLLFCSVILMFTSAVKGESQKINLSSLNSKYLNRGIGEDKTEIMTRSVLLWFSLFVCLFFTVSSLHLLLSRLRFVFAFSLLLRFISYSFVCSLLD